MLAANELSALRRLVVDVRRNAGLAECRITLPDGRVVADVEPSRITAPVLPVRWPRGPLDAQEAEPDGALISFSQPLVVPGRGTATLRIGAAATPAVTERWDFQVGAGLTLALGLVALLAAYRQMRAKVVTLGMIREALIAVGAGERAREALIVGGNGGAEATAWNALLEETEQLRRAGVAEQARGAVDRRREGRGDLEQACDSLSTGLIIVDANGSVRQANGAAASLLGLGRDDLVGKDLALILDHEAIRRTISSTAGGSVAPRCSFEMARVQHENRSVLRVHVRPLRREDASAALVTVDDVTQQRVADESRNSFVAQATHELRTPLTNMRLCLETALEDGSKDPVVLAQSLNVLTQETRRLERTVTEILSVAEIEAGSLQIRRDDVRLEALFEALRADLAPLAKDKDVSLVFDVPPKFPVIHGDRDKLTLALHNVIGNAVKYTPAGGRVVVTLNADGGRTVAEVSDTGIGIAPEEQALIFDKFYRAKDPRVARIKGSGLGLALAREVARLHGGDLTVQSTIDKGSTFTLTLPPGGVPAATDGRGGGAGGGRG